MKYLACIQTFKQIKTDIPKCEPQKATFKIIYGAGNEHNISPSK